jgi:hypothetical protein
MVSLEQYKTALGSRVAKMSDEQIIAQMDLLDKLAGALFDMWRRNMKKGVQEKVDIKTLPDKIQS